ncbi:MAG: TonB family protein [Bacteroidaceae bacterium]|nr:TonB family protein [Bacteroidaceae bacterium]
MEKKQKGKYVGLVGALAVHMLILLLLFLVSFALPKIQEEGGMPVMLGDTPDAYGFADPSLVDVDVMPQEALTTEALDAPDVPSEQDLIVQEEEETVAVPARKQETKKETPKPAVTTPRQPIAQEKAEADRRAAEARAEAERKAAEEAAAEQQRQAQAAARSRVSGAFGRGTQMGSRGNTEGEGLQGSPDGNSDTGATEGVGGYGSYSLGGRSIGPGGLPRPTYNVQEEGRVVVDITVNPAGQVIATGINRQTNTVSAALRRAAEEAAKKARFNEVSGTNNQTGTITYYFKLK